MSTSRSKARRSPAPTGTVVIAVIGVMWEIECVIEWVVGGWVGGWLGGWVGGWVGNRAIR